MASRVVVMVLLTTLVSARYIYLKNHPSIKCSACEAVAQEIGDKMNKTATMKKSVQVGHRLTEYGKGPKRVDWEQSELRAIEIIESVCSTMKKNYKLKTQDGIRIFSKNESLPGIYYYNDKEAIGDDSSLIQHICTEIVDDYFDETVMLIRKERELDHLTEKLCKKTYNACGNQEKIDADRAKEREHHARRDSVEKEKEAIEQQKRMKQEQQKQKAEEEQARKDAIEKDLDSKLSNFGDMDNEKKDQTGQVEEVVTAKTEGAEPQEEL